MIRFSLHFLTLLACLLGSSVWASNLTKPEYAPVASEAERAGDPKYLRFPGFGRIEIIEEGKVKPELLALLETENWSKQISSKNISKLQVRSFDLKHADIKTAGPIVVVPFVVSVLFNEAGPSAPLSLVQGTINSEGYIALVVNKKSGKIIDLQITQFFDDTKIQELGRELEYIDQYDGQFIMGVVPPILRNYFLQDENLTRLIQILESIGDTGSQVMTRL